MKLPAGSGVHRGAKIGFSMNDSKRPAKEELFARYANFI
jgi:hypothetical protein